MLQNMGTYNQIKGRRKQQEGLPAFYAVICCRCIYALLCSYNHRLFLSWITHILNLRKEQYQTDYNMRNMRCACLYSMADCLASDHAKAYEQGILDPLHPVCCHMYKISFAVL